MGRPVHVELAVDEESPDPTLGDVDGSLISYVFDTGLTGSGSGMSVTECPTPQISGTRHSCLNSGSADFTVTADRCPGVRYVRWKVYDPSVQDIWSQMYPVAPDAGGSFTHTWSITPAGCGIAQPGRYNVKCQLMDSLSSVLAESEFYAWAVIEVTRLELVVPGGVPVSEEDDGDNDPNTQLFVIPTIGTGETAQIRVVTNPDILVDPTWSDAGRPAGCSLTGGSYGDERTKNLNLDNPREFDVVFTGCRIVKSIKVLIVKPVFEIKSVKFTSDHGVMTNYRSDYQDGEGVYGEPEWDSSRGDGGCYPISHTMGIRVNVDVILRVSPKGLPFTIAGAGNQGLPGFGAPFEFESTGEDQLIPLTSTAYLPSHVCIIGPASIDWTIGSGVSSVRFDQPTFRTGNHVIYVTYGEPNGSTTTEWRIRKVCEYVSVGHEFTSDASECAKRIFEDMPQQGYHLGTATWGPDPIWLMYADGQVAECPGLALFVSVHFRMLGLSTEDDIRYCLRDADMGGTFEAMYWGIYEDECWYGDKPDYRWYEETSHPWDTTHFEVFLEEVVTHVDHACNCNSFEAACLFNNMFYAPLVTISGGSYLESFDAQAVCQCAFVYCNWVYFLSSNYVGFCDVDLFQPEHMFGHDIPSDSCPSGGYMVP